MVLSMNNEKILEAARKNKNRGKEFEQKESTRSSLLGTLVSLRVGIGSVSYTHLDVYKRQDFEFKSKYNVDDLLSIMRILREPGGCPWAVSYTHLDVYKRQRLHFA